jgi:cell division protein FtsB
VIQEPCRDPPSRGNRYFHTCALFSTRAGLEPVHLCPMLKPTIKKWATNKYLIATAIFLVFLFFGDKNNIIDQVKLHRQYSKVKKEHAYYKKQIDEANRQYKELFSSGKNLEKFAREKYLMKRDDEDVFVIVPEKELDVAPDN